MACMSVWDFWAQKKWGSALDLWWCGWSGIVTMSHSHSVVCVKTKKKKKKREKYNAEKRRKIEKKKCRAASRVS